MGRKSNLRRAAEAVEEALCPPEPRFDIREVLDRMTEFNERLVAQREKVWKAQAQQWAKLAETKYRQMRKLGR